ncbi:hypothetical protein G7045_05595 [Acidovorax sp. HDW3]|uniref:hypothetical protein n=1 Tax=Acidovorax sp. HDW3 TaxID=2714923 RepID=UPI00140E9392|nr:hypothetical protein [Acidovorax sp. HDW3]QIL43776.1 hypothetical protein G7045_05595 [Acidovorax sp. HDW3]
MRSIFTITALVLALGIVGMLAKKQWTSSRVPLVPAAQGGATGTAQQQSQQIQQQVQQQMDQLMQKPRPMPDDESK